MMTNIEFKNKLVHIAKNLKTLYVMGCFGAPMGYGLNRARYKTNHTYNKQANRSAMIDSASGDTFGFDCVCLIKGVLWGFSGDTGKVYGGATYASNGVPDIGADQIIKTCTNISTDFSHVEVGELLWMSGHVGIYIGDGLCVECTPKWDNCVQITSANCDRAGYNRRNWTKHGFLPYVQYVKEEEKTEPTVETLTCPHCGKKLTKDGNKYEEPAVQEPVTKSLKVGDKVRLVKNCNVYKSTKTFQSWVYNTDLFVRNISENGQRIVVSTYKEAGKPVTGAVNVKDVILL